MHPFSGIAFVKSLLSIFFTCGTGMYTQNRETLLKTSLVSWVPLINYYSVLSLIIFKRKIFFEGLSFEIEIWRDN